MGQLDADRRLLGTRLHGLVSVVDTKRDYETETKTG